MEPIFKAIETSLGINRQATRIAVGGFVVMALAIGLVQFSDDDTLTFWQLLVGLLGLMVLMMVLTQLPLMARRAIGWVLTACFSFVAITATGQAITFNACPRLASATCILSFHMAASCAISRPGAGEVVTGAADAAESGTVFAAGVVLRDITFVQGTEERVFIQFAGYQRGWVVGVAEKLAAVGWRVEGGDRGGERISAAAGLNEVRYFNPADADRAAALAADLATVVPGTAPTVVDLSGGKYGQPQAGLLEVWISE
jgi:hypothetical protein